MSPSAFRSRLFSDSQGQDAHVSIKRWERQAQRKFWRQRGENSRESSLPCWWRPTPASASNSTNNPLESGLFPRLRPAALLALFEGDLAVVRYTRDPGEAGGSADIRLLRSGIPWEMWHPWLLKTYIAGGHVPAPFLPIKRLPPAWLEQLLGSSARLQAHFFARLRETGLLRALPKLDAAGISNWMRWKEVRANFLDFKEVKEGVPEKF